MLSICKAKFFQGSLKELLDPFGRFKKPWIIFYRIFWTITLTKFWRTHGKFFWYILWNYRWIKSCKSRHIDFWRKFLKNFHKKKPLVEFIEDFLKDILIDFIKYPLEKLMDQSLSIFWRNPYENVWNSFEKKTDWRNSEKGFLK